MDLTARLSAQRTQPGELTTGNRNVAVKDSAKAYKSRR